MSTSGPSNCWGRKMFYSTFQTEVLAIQERRLALMFKQGCSPLVQQNIEIGPTSGNVADRSGPVHWRSDRGPNGVNCCNKTLISVKHPMNLIGCSLDCCACVGVRSVTVDVYCTYKPTSTKALEESVTIELSPKSMKLMNYVNVKIVEEKIMS